MTKHLVFQDFSPYNGKDALACALLHEFQKDPFMKTQSVIKFFFVPLAALLVLNCSNGGGGAAPTPVDPCYDDAGSLLPSCSTSVSCRDEDGDGYTVGAPSTQTVGLVACSLKTDCDDVNAGIFPGAVEILNDDMDQNCDGVDGINPDVGGGTSGGSSGGSGDDTDGDGVLDVDDNAPGIPNPGQEDTDNDGIPDVVDGEPLVPLDSDGDGIPDNEDNCPSSSDNLDYDGDGVGNGCDNDDDGDGVLDGSDNCPLTSNPQQENNDGDDVGAACDTDEGGVDNDGDGVADLQDNCPSVSNDQNDSDDDDIGDACDVEDCTDGKDNDGDGLIDALDLEQCGPDVENCTDGVDNDGDGQVDAADCDCPLDDDTDGFPDIRANCGMPFEVDNCPGMPNTSVSEFNDTDGDGHGSACDNCANFPNPDQADADGDHKGDACEEDGCVNNPDQACGSILQDSDGDGVPDSTDNCPNVDNGPNEDNQADLDGDDKGDACDTDKDGDGLANSIDPNPISVNLWGYINKNVSGNSSNETCVNEDGLYSYAYRAGEFHYRVIVQGVMYLKNATPSLPEKDNCRKKDGAFVSIPLAKGDNTLQYGIYIRTGVSVEVQPGSKTGGNSSSAGEDAPSSMLQLRFRGRSLMHPNWLPAHTVTDEFLNNIQLRVHVGDGLIKYACAKLSDEDLLADGSSAAKESIIDSINNEDEWWEFTVNLNQFKICGGENPFLEEWVLDDIKYISMQSTKTTRIWGIKELRITAIYHDGDSVTERIPFYNNKGVWAYVGKNSNAGKGKYPRWWDGRTCMGEGVYGGFDDNYPGLPDVINVAGNSNMRSSPVGDLYFRPKDYWVKIKLRTADKTDAGSTNSIYFQFKNDTCSTDSNASTADILDTKYIELFYLHERNTEKEMRFYTPHTNETIVRSGFRLKLGFTDDLMLSKYHIEAHQAWSLEGKSKWFKGQNGANDSVVRLQIGDNAGVSQSTTRGMTEQSEQSMSE